MLLRRPAFPKWKLSPIAPSWSFRHLVGICIVSFVGICLLSTQTRYSVKNLYITGETAAGGKKELYHDPKDDIPKAENTAVAQYFIKHPVVISEFGELGNRVSMLTGWMEEWGDHAPGPKGGDARFDFPTPYTPDNYTVALENLTVAMFPFIRDPKSAKLNPEPLRMMRKKFRKGRGIVIPTSTKTFRYALHLIVNLRTILHSDLPIQILYYGEENLPLKYRKALKKLERMDVDFIDIREELDDRTMGLEVDHWAIKPFAILASTFSEVMLIDADATFLQKPEVIFDKHEGYRRTGTLFFHDRLVDKGEYEARHEWWQRQMEKHAASETFQKSITMKEKFGHEGDSGVVVIDKGRLNVLMGLLHVCWQNTKEVREKETYTHIHGDKETYWLGMELSGVPYAFSEHYAAAIGKWSPSWNGSVHGSQLAQVDQDKKLLWLNGSLLKKKEYGGDLREYYVPDKWMFGGRWTWTLDGEFLAFMNETEPLELSVTERGIIGDSVNEAKLIDKQYGEYMDLPPIKTIAANGTVPIRRRRL